MVVVIILAFHSDDPSSNPRDANIFLFKLLFQLSENKLRGRDRSGLAKAKNRF